MANVLYNRGSTLLVTTHSWGTSGITVRLLDNTYTPIPTHNTNADLTGELSGNGYAALTALTGQAVVEVDADNRTEFRANKAVFPTLGAAAPTPRWLTIEDTTTGGLIVAVDLTASATAPDGNDYEVLFDNVDGVGHIFSLGGANRLGAWLELTDTELNGALENNGGSLLTSFGYSTDRWRGIMATGANAVQNGLRELIGVPGSFSTAFGSNFDTTLHVAQMRIQILEWSTGVIQANRWGVAAGIRQTADEEGLGFAAYDASPGPAWFWVNDPTGPSLTNALVADNASVLDAPTELVSSFWWTSTNELVATGIWNGREGGVRGPEATRGDTTNPSISTVLANLELINGIIHVNSGAAVANQEFEWRLYARKVPIEDWFAI